MRSPALLELTRVRLVEFIRQPEAVFWVFVFPVLLAVALGVAFRTPKAARIPVAVASSMGHHQEVVRLLAEADGLNVAVLAPEAAAEALRKGRVDLVIDAATGEGADGLTVAYRFDPTRADGRTARLAVDQALQRALGRQDVARVSDETVVQPGSRYIDFLIPGLIGLNLMGSGMWGLGFSIVVARTRNLLKRFAVTPMRRSDYLLSYALSRLGFLVLEVAAIVGFGWLAFDVQVRGSLLALGVVSILGGATFAGLGLLVAARPRSIEAVSGWMNLVMLPMWLLSGSFFSYERFPAVVLPAIRLLPLTALNDALRAVMNDGAGLLGTWPELAVLAGWGVGSFVCAMRLFRWQ